MPLLALLICWRMGPPALFRQQGPCRDGEPFTLLKFRTGEAALVQEGGR